MVWYKFIVECQEGIAIGWIILFILSCTIYCNLCSLCVCSSRTGGAVYSISNTGEDDETGNLVFREN